MKSAVVIVLCFVLATPAFPQTPELQAANRGPFVSWFTHNYTARPLPRVNFEDSARIDKLMRAGNLYLSLRDTIALALENNLDLEYARYNPRLAEANLLRASAGSLLRNVSNNISSGPSSASLGVLAGTRLGSGGTGGGASSGSGQGGVLSGLNVQLAGSSVPNLDPTFFIVGQYVHNTTIQTATNIAGTNALVTEYKSSNAGIQQGLLTGTTLQLGMGNQFGVAQNSPFNQISPYDQANLSISIQQNLLQGFRRSVNNRYIRVARNQRQISDLTFRNQVMATVANVVGLYWDLVSFNESLKVKQRTLELNTKLFNDNRRRAELGAIAPIDIVQAEAEMKASQQEVTTAESQVFQQETILKAVLTRSGLQRLEIANARIVPTDHFQVPSQESIQPIQDLIAEAMRRRPDMQQSTIALENARITTLGVKDALLPQLTAFVNTSNAGVAGQVNTIPTPVTGADGTIRYISRTPADVNQYFLGGYGSVLRQIFGRNFPNYNAGVSLNIPIRNRAAQADLITDQLNYRQQQIQDRQLHNSVRQNVINSRIALEQARAAYDTSVEARRLQEQSAQGTRRKYDLGTASILDVVITQRDTTARELAEVQARSQYIQARLNLNNVLGRILEEYAVDIEEAKTGVVGRDPDLSPATAGADRSPAKR